MFICFVDFDFLIECATNLKCKQQHGRRRIINMCRGGSMGRRVWHWDWLRAIEANTLPHTLKTRRTMSTPASNER